MSTDGSQLGFAELLRLAGSKGLQELDVQITQVPDEANAGHAVVLASARTSGALYRAVGEAWRDELPAAHRYHALTVAERRAKIRVLCEAVGMPQAMISEVDAGVTRPEPQSEAAPTQTLPAPVETRPVQRTETRPAAQATSERDTPPNSDGGSQPREQAATLAPGAGAASRATLPPRQMEAQAPRAAGPDASAVERPAPGPQPRGAVPRPPEAAMERPRPEPVRPGTPPVAPEPLGPDIYQQLMRMMHQKGELDGEEITDEEAHARLDSFFQRAFNHSMEEGTRVEGKQTIQRLASVISRLKQDRAQGPASAAS